MIPPQLTAGLAILAGLAAILVISCAIALGFLMRECVRQRNWGMAAATVIFWAILIGSLLTLWGLVELR